MLDVQYFSPKTKNYGILSRFFWYNYRNKKKHCLRFGGRIAMPLFLFIFHIFYNIHTFIQSHSHNTFIRRHSLGPLSISSSLESSVGRPSLWCRAENRTRACLTASRRATNWATPHHVWATPHHKKSIVSVVHKLVPVPYRTEASC